MCIVHTTLHSKIWDLRDRKHCLCVKFNLQTRRMIVWRWSMSGSLINLSTLFTSDDDKLNLTSSLVDDSNSLEKKNYWALLLLLLCIAVVFGNVLVILSVAKVLITKFTIRMMNDVIRSERYKTWRTSSSCPWQSLISASLGLWCLSMLTPWLVNHLGRIWQNLNVMLV